MELDLYIKRVNVHSDLVVTKNHLIQTLRIFVHEKTIVCPLGHIPSEHRTN